MQSVQSAPGMQLDSHHQDQISLAMEPLAGTTGQQVAQLAAAISSLASPLGHHDNHSRAQQLGAASSLSSSSGALQAGASGNRLGRLVGKKASRVKELLMQNLGRAERTTDQLFNLYEENFFKQHQQATRISKEFKSYLNSMKSFHESSKSLNGYIKQTTGDCQAARHDLICDNLSQLEHLNEQLLDKLREQILHNMDDYLGQFDELKQKISKRHRKLIDFDSSRRALNVVLSQMNKKRMKQQQQQQSAGGQSSEQQGPAEAEQRLSSQTQLARGLRLLSQQQPQGESAASQLVDEARLLKLREQFNYCRLMYETINSELHEELPLVYEKKMRILWSMLRNYFALEAHYHSAVGKLVSSALDVIDEAPVEFLGSIGLIKAARKRADGHPREDDNDDEDQDDEEDDEDQGDDSMGGATDELGRAASNSDPAATSSGDEMMAYHHPLHHHLEHKNRLRDHQVSSSDQAHQLMAKSGANLRSGGSSSGMGSSRGDSSSASSLVNDDDQSSLSNVAESPDIRASEQQQPASAESIGQLESDEEPAAARSHSGKGALPANCCPDGSEPLAGRQDEQIATLNAEPQAAGGSHASAAAAHDRQAPAAAAAAPPPAPHPDHSDAESEPCDEPAPGASLVGLDIGHIERKLESLRIVEQLETVGGVATLASAGADDGKQDAGPELGQLPGAESLVAAGSSSVLDHSADTNQEEQEDVCLYKVQTNYKYLAEDVDELCFEADEIIQVIEFDESHEPEDGWLMGVREVNGQRGLFPANYTRPI